MSTETLTRSRMEILKEIRLAIIAAFLAKGYKVLVHFNLSKEVHSASYFDLTILPGLFDARKNMWTAMNEALEAEFDGNTDFKFLNDEYGQVRILVGEEYEIRKNQPPKEKLVVVDEIIEEIPEPIAGEVIIPLIVKQISPPVQPKPEKKPKPVRVVKPINRNLLLKPKQKKEVLYEPKILANMYIKIHISLRNNVGLTLGRDYTLSAPDGTSLVFRFIPSQSNKLRFSLEQRLDMARTHFAEAFGNDVADSYFSIVVSTDPEHKEILLLDVSGEYGKRKAA